MRIARRIFVSLPADPWLAPNLNRIKWGIVDEIAKHGFVPEIFTNPRGAPGIASARSWHPREAEDVARRCVGAAIIGMPRWRFTDNADQQVLLPTEFNHYEGALANTLALPIMVLAQKNLLRRVVFDVNFGQFIGEFDENDDVQWLHDDQFRVPFGYWLDQIRMRKDFFLGYSGKSTGAATAIKQFLQSEGVSILDWQSDFIAGRTIIDQIEQAAKRTTGGVFLFTKDDNLDTKENSPVLVPRDNVVFEAGFFAGMKGKKHVLIIREDGAKMPADLGGDIYASLQDRSDISTIHAILRSFITSI